MTEQSVIQSVPIRMPRQPNPVYEHLTRRRRWPSVRMAVILWISLSWLGAIVPAAIWQLVAGTNTALGSGSITPTGFISVPILLVSLVAAISSPIISAAVTAVGTARFANDEAIALLKLTRITPGTIVWGYLRAALFRLRLLWAVCFGLLIPSVAAATLVGLETMQATFRLAGGGPQSASLLDALFTAGLSAIPIGCVALISITLNWLAVCVGVWSGLRTAIPAHAIALALSGILIALLPIPVSLLAAILGDGTGAILFGLLAEIMITILYPALGAILLLRAEARLSGSLSDAEAGV